MYLSNPSSFFFLSHLIIVLISDDSKYSKYYMKIVVLKYLYLVLKKNDIWSLTEEPSPWQSLKFKLGYFVGIICYIDNLFSFTFLFFLSFFLFFSRRLYDKFIPVEYEYLSGQSLGIFNQSPR